MQDIQVGIAYRGWVAESHHRGRIVVTNPDGTVRLALGSTEEPMLPRSALKPFQVIGMLESGLDLDGHLLALAGASHWGEPIHTDGTLEILAGVGLDATALVNTADLPLHEPTRFAWLRAGRGKEPIAHNCSGKHAAKLRTCIINGWDLATYRDPDHPLQRVIRRVIEERCGVIGEPVVDGCTAPAFSTALPGLARGFGWWASQTEGHAARIADAYRQHPEYMSGTLDPSVNFHRSVPGLVLKLGAEGILAAGLPDGTGIALKMSDGMGRGRFDVMAAVLAWLGHRVEGLTPEVVIAPELAEALAVG